MTDIDLTTITDADWPTFWAGVLAENAHLQALAEYTAGWTQTN